MGDARGFGVPGGHKSGADARSGDFAGGPDVDESDLEEIVMWAPEEEGAGNSEISEEDGPNPPL